MIIKIYFVYINPRLVLTLFIDFYVLIYNVLTTMVSASCADHV